MGKPSFPLDHLAKGYHHKRLGQLREEFMEQELAKLPARAERKPKETLSQDEREEAFILEHARLMTMLRGGYDLPPIDE